MKKAGIAANKVGAFFKRGLKKIEDKIDQIGTSKEK